MKRSGKVPEGSDPSGPAVWLVAGFLLIAAGVACRLIASAYFDTRLRPDWSWTAGFVGVQTWADEKTGAFPERDSTSVYERDIRVVNASGEWLEMEDRYTVLDPATKHKTWEYIYRARVDPRTGAHTAPEHRGDYFVFPANVEKRTYNLRFNYIKGLPLRFVREDAVEGVPAYLFSYEGRGEYTESYAGTADFKGVPVEAGQEIACLDDQLKLRFWVEPVTGEILRLAESCLSGDYVFETAAGKAVRALSRWSGETAGNDVIRRAGRTAARRSRILMARIYAPALLAAAGAVVLALAAARWRRGLYSAGGI